MALSPKFVKQMYKPKTYQNANLGRMTASDMRKEYTKMSKIANKRIGNIERAGLYSPAVENLSSKGIHRFGLKNQNLNTDADIKKAYKGLMDFLNSTTSSRTGIKTTSDKMIQNFGMTFNGNYAEFSQKARKIFDLYEDLREMANQGYLSSSDKYDIISDLNTLYETGLIDENTTADQLVGTLNKMIVTRKQNFTNAQSQLNFNWRV